MMATLQTMIGVLDFGLDPAAALAAPRIHHQWAPAALVTETDFEPSTAVELTKRGHTIRRVPFAGAVSVVGVRDGVFVAASDQRKHGGAAAR